MEGGGLQESYHMVSLLRRGPYTSTLWTTTYFLSYNNYVLFHVVMTSFLYTSTLSNTVHRANRD